MGASRGGFLDRIKRKRTSIGYVRRVNGALSFLPASVAGDSFFKCAGGSQRMSTGWPGPGEFNTKQRRLLLVGGLV